MDANLSIPRIHEFIELWVQISWVQLCEDVEGKIVWNLTGSGEYSSSSVYKAQFFGSTVTNMNKMV